MESMNLKENELQEITQLRHRLHQHPNRSHEETETAEIISTWAKNHLPSFEIHTGIGGAGVLLIQKNKTNKKRIVLRAELDALPIEEANSELSYASKNPGTSHKCGHDGHMAMICGLGLLIEREPLKEACIALLFQPAEETGEGARLVLKNETFEEFNPDYVFALHNLPEHPKSEIMVKKGSMCMASTGIWLRLRGASSHAAEPYAGTSPLPVINQCLDLWQFERTLNKQLEVSTLVHLQLGEPAFGTTPGWANAALTIRAETDERLQELVEELKQKCNAICQVHGLHIEFETTEDFAAVHNTDKEVDNIIEAAKALNLQYSIMESPTRWSEDVGELLKNRKGGLFCLGSGTETPVLHHPTYNFPDDILSTGVKMFYEIAKRTIHQSS